MSLTEKQLGFLIQCNLESNWFTFMPKIIEDNAYAYFVDEFDDVYRTGVIRLSNGKITILSASNELNRQIDQMMKFWKEELTSANSTDEE